jgi:hypothetical protein
VGASILGLLAFAGCSGESGGPDLAGQKPNGAVSFDLLTSSSVELDSIHYDVATQFGTDVVNGSIAVPDDQSQHVPVLGIQSLSVGDYALTLSASGKFPDDTSAPCTSPKMGFHVNAGANTFIGDVTLTCITTTQVDNSAGILIDTSVTTVTQTVNSVRHLRLCEPRPKDAHAHRHTRRRELDQVRHCHTFRRRPAPRWTS